MKDNVLRVKESELADLITLSFFVGNDVIGIPIRGRVHRGRMYYVGSSRPVLNVLRKSPIFQLAEKVIRESDGILTQRRLHEFAETHGFTIVDPLPQLRTQHSRDDRLYIPTNTHWNVKGNRLAGEILAAAVAAELTADGRGRTENAPTAPH